MGVAWGPIGNYLSTIFKDIQCSLHLFKFWFAFFSYFTKIRISQSTAFLHIIASMSLKQKKLHFFNAITDLWSLRSFWKIYPHIKISIFRQQVDLTPATEANSKCWRKKSNRGSKRNMQWDFFPSMVYSSKLLEIWKAIPWWQRNFLTQMVTGCIA